MAADVADRKKQAKNKNGIVWVEPLSPERWGWWAWAACPEGWWVIQIPYALWHMRLEGSGGGVKQRSVRSGRKARRGGGVLFRIINEGKGCWRVLNHTPYRRTQPPPPGDRERAQKEMGRGTEDTTKKTKRKTRQVLRYGRETFMQVKEKQCGPLLRLDWQTEGLTQHLT